MVQILEASFNEPALRALRDGLIGARIAGLSGAAIGATVGFAGLNVSLRESGGSYCKIPR